MLTNTILLPKTTSTTFIGSSGLFGSCSQCTIMCVSNAGHVCTSARAIRRSCTPTKALPIVHKGMCARICTRPLSCSTLNGNHVMGTVIRSRLTINTSRLNDRVQCHLLSRGITSCSLGKGPIPTTSSIGSARRGTRRLCLGVCHLMGGSN